MRWKDFKRKYPEKVEADADFIERTLKSYLEGTSFKNLKNYVNYIIEKKRKTKIEGEDK